MLPEELDLLAFRYVAGEMAPDEAAAFETGLADDQAARLAVSRAVGLTQRLREAMPPPTSPVVRPLKHSFGRAAQPLGWMAIGAAAAALIVILASRPSDPNNAPQPAAIHPNASRPPADVLVFARLQADHESTAAELERWLDEPNPRADDADDSLLTTEIPSWAFASIRHPANGERP